MLIESSRTRIESTADAVGYEDAAALQHPRVTGRYTATPRL